MTARAKTYNRQVARFLAVVGQSMPRLSGNVMRRWSKDRKALRETLRTALYLPEPMLAVRKRKPWKRVDAGIYRNTHEFHRALLRARDRREFVEDPSAGMMLANVKLSNIEIEFDLVLVTGRDLGFSKATRRDLIYKRAKTLGLHLLPAEIGPRLRMLYTDQPMNECIVIGMEPLAGLDHKLHIFSLKHDGVRRWLGGCCGNADVEWDIDICWAFARREGKFNWRTWNSLKLGVHKSARNLFTALAAGPELRLEKLAREILWKIPLAKSRTEIELVLVIPEDLGLEGEVSRAAIYRRAKKLGLHPVPAEVAPQLQMHLQHFRQEIGIPVVIGMKPVVSPAGQLCLFYLRRDEDGRWLRVCSGNPRLKWQTKGILWVFARHKQK